MFDFSSHSHPWTLHWRIAATPLSGLDKMVVCCFLCRPVWSFSSPDLCEWLTLRYFWLQQHSFGIGVPRVFDSFVHLRVILRSAQQISDLAWCVYICRIRELPSRNRGTKLQPKPDNFPPPQVPYTKLESYLYPPHIGQGQLQTFLGTECRLWMLWKYRTLVSTVVLLQCRMRAKSKAR